MRCFSKRIFPRHLLWIILVALFSERRWWFGTFFWWDKSGLRFPLKCRCNLNILNKILMSTKIENLVILIILSSRFFLCVVIFFKADYASQILVVTLDWSKLDSLIKVLWVKYYFSKVFGFRFSWVFRVSVFHKSQGVESSYQSQ